MPGQVRSGNHRHRRTGTGTGTEELPSMVFAGCRVTMGRGRKEGATILGSMAIVIGAATEDER